MKKRMLVILGMAVFLLGGCVGKEEAVQTENLEVSEVTEIQEMFVGETKEIGDTETDRKTEIRKL